AARPPTPEKTRVQSQAPTPMIDDAPPVTAAPTPAPEDTPPITGPETKAAQPQAKPSATGPLIQEVPDSPTGRLAAWERVVASVCESKPALGAVLEHAVPIEVSRTQIVLGFAEGSFFGQQASSSESTTAIASAAASILGGKPAVSVKFSAPDNLGASVAEIATTRRDEEREETRRRALNHPRVIEALQVFPEGAGQVKVRLDQEEG
ncbi:MAG: hypothetical protein KC416_12785, partial [Myxococcales bacterium]|nr:hypothetical protein [Myxococcales bacterium]